MPARQKDEPKGPPDGIPKDLTILKAEGSAGRCHRLRRHSCRMVPRAGQNWQSVTLDTRVSAYWTPLCQWGRLLWPCEDRSLTGTPRRTNQKYPIPTASICSHSSPTLVLERQLTSMRDCAAP